MNKAIKPPTWFWVVSVLALVWNLMGVMAYLGRAFMTPEMMEAMPADQVKLLEETPAWATAAFAVAVWGGTLGCLLLLLRKSAAHFILWLSLLGIVVQMIYNFFIANAMEVYGPGGAIMPIMVLLVGLLLVLFSKSAKKKAWLS